MNSSVSQADGWDQKARDRAAIRMNQIDNMSPEMRAVVHEHGFTIVKSFLDQGITKPAVINHLIDRVREGSVEVGRRTENILFKTTPHSERIIGQILQWFNAPPVAKQLLGYLLRRGKIIAPLEPSTGMIDASMAAVVPLSMGGAVLDKRTKHKLRLRAALEKAAREQMVGGISDD